jgi:hypothetical protein
MQDQLDHTRGDIIRLDKELVVIKAQIDLLKWMNGIVIRRRSRAGHQDLLRLTGCRVADRRD